MVIALLAGGTGGAKLAVALRDWLVANDAGELRVIANTGDDIEIYGVHVSPDPDLISFRLAGVLNDAGYGIEGESHDEMDRRRAAGERIWFELGDDDLAVCRARTAALAAGATLTEAHAAATAGYPPGPAAVLPMCDEPVRTIVLTPGGERGLQQYMIQDRSEPPIASVIFEGIDDARPTEQVLAAIAEADVIVIGPSNPVISIGPILAVPGMRAAIETAGAPVLAVSPYVGGEVLKGPTAKFMDAAGAGPGSAGAAEYYGDLVDHWIADEPAGRRPTQLADVRIAPVRTDGGDSGLRLAAEIVSLTERIGAVA